ncbi:MAG: hypothetical protein V9E96_08585 [Chitinophagaceae bacterium]
MMVGNDILKVEKLSAYADGGIALFADVSFDIEKTDKIVIC